jgi:heme/copper-type cytochrome/quinol oxidase subunit 2
MLQAKPVTNITNSAAPIIIVIFSLVFIILFYLLTKLHF